MALVLKSVKMSWRLMKFAEHARFLYFKEEFSPLLLRNILPVTTVKSRHYMLKSHQLKAENLEKITFDLNNELKQHKFFSKQDIEKILSGLRNWKSITYPQTLALLKCCTNISFVEKPEVKVKLTEKIWETLKDLGIKFDIFHYNSLLFIYVQNQHSFSPSEFLTQLKNAELQPNIVTYQRLLKAYCQQGDISGASSLLEQIKDQNLSVNEDIFNSLIYGHCQLDDIENAVGIINLMKKKGVNPSSESYTHIMCAHARNGRFTQIENVLAECESMDLNMQDKDLLEVIYALAISGHEAHIDNLLKKIVKSINYRFYATSIIHRLLHKNLDDAALKVHATFSKSESSEIQAQNKSVFLFHYLRIRTLDETINLCKTLGKPGEFNVALAMALKSLMLNEDVDKSLEFISKASELDFELRTHYFWPLLVKASSGGNKQLLKVLKAMQKLKVSRCRDTVSRFLTPYYRFGPNIEEDLEIFRKHGIQDSFFVPRLLHHLISEKKLKKAAVLSFLKPVDLTNEIIELLLKNVNEKNSSDFAEIIYNLAHDEHLTSVSEEEEGNTAASENCEKFLDKILLTLIEEQPAATISSVLKEILKKPMKISEETALTIKQKFIADEGIAKSVEELSSSDRNFILNERILNNKKKMVLDDHYYLQRAAGNEEAVKAETLFEKLGDKATPLDLIAIMTLYVKNDNIEKAMELAENLKRDSFTTVNYETKRKFWIFLNKLGEKNNLDALEKAIKLGCEMGLCESEKLCFLKIKSCITRDELDQAVGIFCQECVENGKITGYEILMNALINAQNANLLLKTTNACATVLGEGRSLVKLFFQFAKKGYSKQAKKLLETQKVNIDTKTLKFHSDRFYKDKNENALKCLLENSKDHFEVDYVLSCLLNLYIQADDPNKVENLWLVVQEGNFAVDNAFCETMFSYLKKKGRDVPFSGKAQENLIKTDTKDQTEDSKNPESRKKISELIQLAKDKNYEEFFSDKKVLSKKKLLVVGKKLLQTKEEETFINLLKATLEKEPQFFSYLIPFNQSKSHLKKNPKLLESLFELANINWEKNNLTNPMKKMILLCFEVPEKIELIKGVINKLTDPDVGLKLFDINSPSLQKYIENKEIGGDTRPSIYSILIKNCGLKGELDKAVEFLSKAVEEGIGHKLNTDSLQMLKDKMEEGNREFPYPDLLIQAK